MKNSETTPTRFPRPRLNRLLLPILLMLIGIWLAQVIRAAYIEAALREAYIPQLQEMVQQNPENSRLWSLLGGRLTEATRYDEATAAFERAIAAGDMDPVIWLALAGCEASNGRNHRVLAELSLGIRKGVPGLQEEMDRIKNLKLPARTDPGLATLPDGRVRCLLVRAGGSFLSPLLEWWGRRHPVQSGFATRERWATEQPGNALAQRLRGEAWALNGADSRALPALQRAESFDPRTVLTHLDLAELFNRESRPLDAQREYLECLKLRPQWATALLGLSQVNGSSYVHFSDVVGTAGLRYTWTIPGNSPHNILELIGNGCALLDYNNDGNLDILLLGPRLALYRGDGHGHFVDVTHETGLDRLSGHFLGCAVSDYDNDGFEDIYLSAYRGGLLLHNESGKKFRDVTREAGIKPQPWGTSCSFADVDNDGKLDLYIGNYVQFGPEPIPQLCTKDGITSACGPGRYVPLHGVLYHNEGGGRFRDVSRDWGAVAGSGKTLGVAFADYNNSGRQSIALANDGVPGDLLQNTGSLMANVAVATGTAYDPQGHANAGMGIDWGDYDNDGLLDLAVAAYQGETKCLYHNENGAAFANRSLQVGLDSRAAGYLCFGLKWLDYDNDGWLDLALANGHALDNIRQFEPNSTFEQPTQLFHNLHGSSFVDVSQQSGEALQRKIVGRGLAVGDFDNDGRVDMLVVDSGGSPLLLHNETTNSGNWLSIRLRGTKSNRDGIGAMVSVEAGGLKQYRRCGTDGSYLSASDRRVHLGIGKAAYADSIVIQWPSGKATTLHHVPANRIVDVRE